MPDVPNAIDGEGCGNFQTEGYNYAMNDIAICRIGITGALAPSGKGRGRAPEDRPHAFWKHISKPESFG